MSTFHFKQFSVKQSSTAMKVGTDSMLLGSLSYHKDPKRILDVGTGTGVLALMMAQRFPMALVRAVEIEESAFTEAKLNIEVSPFSKRVDVEHCDFLNFEFEAKFDLIISNPPYFVNSLKNDSLAKSAARHADSLDAENFLRKAAQLLAKDGVVDVIIPYDLTELWETAARSNELFVNRKIVIQGKSSTPVNRIIVSFGASLKPCKSSSFIIREDDNSYSSSYVELTKEFHDRVPK